TGQKALHGRGAGQGRQRWGDAQPRSYRALRRSGPQEQSASDAQRLNPVWGRFRAVMDSREQRNLSRRNLLAGALATAVSIPLLNACAPSTPSAPAPAAGGGAGGGQPQAAKSLFPTY